MAFIVKTLLGGEEVDSQKVTNASMLEDNDYVKFNKKARLSETAGDVFSGGTNGEVTGESHQKARDAFESYTFNVLCVPVTDETELNAYINYTKRQREEYGVKFQMVCPKVDGVEPNYEGVITLGTEVKDEGYDKKTALCYWVAGAEAGCEIQSSVMARDYDGRFTPNSKVTRAEMRKAIEKGVLIFHDVDRVPVVLKDINSLTQISDKDKDKKNDDFKSNQTVRVIDGRANDIAHIFNTYYLAKKGNTEINRLQLKDEVIESARVLERKQAIQPYDESYTSFEMGNTIRDVIGREAIQPVNAMERLFMTITLI